VLRIYPELRHRLSHPADAAKSIALGAKCTGMALPFLKAGASGGKKGIRKFLNDFIREFKIAMFLTGSKKVSELKGKVAR